jgi:hypothetical protein
VKTQRASCLIVTAAGLAVLPLPWLAERVWAQAAVPRAGDGSTDGGSALLVGGAIVVALLVVTGFLVKMFDLKRRRETEAVHLQAQVADALLRDPILFRLPITPTARVPLWRGTPAVIELAGQVPSEEQRSSVLRTVQEEALRLRSDVQIESRIAVVPAVAHRAA